jgi:hypothetical protein
MNTGDIQTFYPSTPGLGLNSHVEEHGFGGPCGNKPLDPSIDPTLWNGLCVWDCGKKKNYNPDNNTGKPCCVQHHNQAVRRETRRREIKEYYVCKNAPVPDDNTPPPDTTPPPPPDTTVVDAANKAKWEAATKSAYAGLSCDDMIKTYGITSKSWGSASDAAVGEFSSRCTVSGASPRGRANIPGSGPDDSGVDQKANNKKWIIIGVVAVVAIITIALVVRAMRSKGKK